MRKKMKKQGGFTLVEMLIVVAIIAILIAVSIPLVAGALEGAREATDAANERSFKAALVTGYLLNDANMSNGATKISAGNTYVYDAVNGVATDQEVKKAYGQSKDDEGDCKTVEPDGKILIGSISTDGTVSMKWADIADAKYAEGTTVTAGPLVSESLGDTTPTTP